jgi:excisionase family DNA binding protein
MPCPMHPHTKPNSPQPSQLASHNAAQIVPLTLSVAEAAEIIGISKPSIYRLLDRRVLHAIPHLRHKRIARIEVVKLTEGGHNRA